MSISANTRAVRGAVLGAAIVAVLGTAACSNSGSASAPAPALPPTSTTSGAAPTTSPGAGGPATASPAPGSPTAAAGQSSPGAQSSGAQSSGPSSPAPSGLPPAGGLPLDTNLYPPPDVPRTAANTSKESAYLKDLQKGGLTVTASGATEITIGNAICTELAKGGSIENMKKLLVPVGSVAAGLGKTPMTGDQVADLYLSSAKADLC